MTTSRAPTKLTGVKSTVFGTLSKVDLVSQRSNGSSAETLTIVWKF